MNCSQKVNNSSSKESTNEVESDEVLLKENLNKIENRIVVLSGKGGVGKSTVAVNLAASLSAEGYKVGLLDVDIHGPSIPTLLGINDVKLSFNAQNRILPVTYSENLKVLSVGFIIENNHDPIIWRGPMKSQVIKQFLKDTEWGKLDYLIVDCPPGTGDEPLAVCQLIEDVSGAVVVTTPQDLALIDVKKSVTFCKKIDINILGVVENMSGFCCPHCSEKIDVFKTDGAKEMAREMDIPFLGFLPLNRDIMLCGDDGKPVVLNGEKEGIRDSFKTIISNIKINLKNKISKNL